MAIEYHLTPRFGVAVGVTGFTDVFGETPERRHLSVAPTSVVYFTPDLPASPFITAGVTWQDRNVVDTYDDGSGDAVYVDHSSVWAPHVGGGADIAVGERWAVDVEGRLLLYPDRWADAALPVALQTTVAIGHHF